MGRGQTVKLVENGTGKVKTYFKNRFSLNADNFCVHGDRIVSEGEMYVDLLLFTTQPGQGIRQLLFAGI